MLAVSPSSPSKTPHSHSPQPPNPLSTRLYKVLAANFDDDSTKEALNTLAELYAPAIISTSANVKGKGSSSKGDVPGDLAARARKNLKRDVESKLAESSRKFLDAFAEVDKQLDTLQEHIGTMRTRCDEAQTQLQQTSEACQSLLDRAGSLREQRQDIASRQSVVSLFLSRFTLTSDEAEAITSREVPVGPRFFAAMDKTEKIREDCRVLMAGEDGPTQAGLDIMAATSNHLEQAYDKIFRYCSFEFRQMGRDAQTEVGHTMQQAVKRLQRRPELLNEGLSLLSQTRQATFMNGFMDALTRGGPGGLPRPIELHAHDPMRYVGDMLAWVHQAIAAEREFLESLFGVKGDRRMVGA
ncbi:hypothetical protein QCA50_003509 [Cerrena zonata]|uniref:Conserved oligomeric Golgi complex subunit 6 n=1 Tax=Cerrena zonata TaxID=2478898 RepID=A0AAW0GS98_9APHY